MEEKDLIFTKQILKSWGEDVLSSMRGILVANNKSATGDLINSLKYEITYKNEDLQLEFEMIDYGKYVDGGRLPGKQPPIQSILNWTRIKGIPDKFAFPIAKKIGKFGIKPVPFFDSTIESNKNVLIKELESAMTKDITVWIQKQILKKF